MISVERLTKRYGGRAVVDDVSLEVPRGDLVVLLGESGCGKSTLLRMIAGLLVPDEGRILLEGREITALPPQRRGMGFVFQNYSVFRHLSVAENVEFPLKLRGVPREKRRARRELLLGLVGLAGLEGRFASELSGGQQQRVALARALAHEPPVLLLDEPFAAVDARTRTQLRQVLRKTVDELGVTTILVTHDQEEAFALADRLAIVRDGRLEQYGRPPDVYGFPASRYVATFVGRMNLFSGRVTESTAEHCDLLVADRPVRRRGAHPFRTGQPVAYGVRPEQVRVSLSGPREYENGIVGTIESASFLGSLTRFAIRLPGGRAVDVDALNYLVVDGAVVPWEVGGTVWLIWSQGSGTILADEAGPAGSGRVER